MIPTNNNQQGKIEKVQGNEVTVSNADGTKTIAPANMLSRDPSGKLTLNKAAFNTANPGQQQQQQQQGTASQDKNNPVLPGQQVYIADDLDRLKFLSKYEN